MKEISNLHKDMDMGIVHVVRHVHVCTMFYWVFPRWSNDHCSGVLFGSPLLLPLLGILEYLLELFYEYMGCLLRSHHHLTN